MRVVDQEDIWSLNRFNPKEIIGIDSGPDIIKANKKDLKIQKI